ncbi:hypothetical protein LCGC14_0406400 [marine sediment metagenome]|uniref:Uncharacterized protein n=1 Tax=marine sediment metagenome TaxID=412755 RepID=A0A0F9VHF0_9ZZZZ
MDKRKEQLKELGIVITGNLDSARKNLNRKFNPVAKRKKLNGGKK